MLDPSSSEEESDEGLEEESRDVLVAAGGSQRAPPAPAREGRRDAAGRAGGGAARPVSPSPSMLSEGRDEPERQLDEEQERRIRLQLYVFVVRCIAYPFNAKQPTDMARRQQKVSYLQDPAFPTSTSSSLSFSPGKTVGPLPAVLLQDTAFLLLLEGKGIFGCVCRGYSFSARRVFGCRGRAFSPTVGRSGQLGNYGADTGPAVRLLHPAGSAPAGSGRNSSINFNFKTAVVHSCPLLLEQGFTLDMNECGIFSREKV